MVNAGQTAWDQTGMPPEYFDSRVNRLGPAGGYGFRDSQGRMFQIPGAGMGQQGIGAPGVMPAMPPQFQSPRPVGLPQGPLPTPPAIGGAGLALALSGAETPKPKKPTGFVDAAQQGAQAGQPVVSGGAGLARALASIQNGGR